MIVPLMLLMATSLVAVVVFFALFGVPYLVRRLRSETTPESVPALLMRARVAFLVTGLASGAAGIVTVTHYSYSDGIAFGVFELVFAVLLLLLVVWPIN